jgi:hypothetical protein
MSASAFEQNNQAFLKAALEWLRMLLQSRALGLEHQEHGNLAEQAAIARQAMAERAAANPKPAFSVVVESFCLSPFDCDLLLLAAAMEIDPDLPALISAWHGDPARRFPTLALALSIFDEQQRESDALSPRRPLRRFQLLEVHQGGGGPLLTANLRIDEHVAGLIKGEANEPDDRLLALLSPLGPGPALPPSQIAIAQTLARWLSADDPIGIVQLTGADAVSKRDVIAVAASWSQRQAYAIAAEAVPVHADEFDSFVKIWRRESRLLRLILYVEGVEPTAAPAGDDRAVVAVNPRLLRNLRRLGEPTVVDTRKPLAELESSGILEVRPPSELERRELWNCALKTHGVHVPASSLVRLASEFTLASSRIEENAAQALLSMDENHRDGQACVVRAWEVCISRGSTDLEGLADRIEPKARLADVKLTPSGRAELERLVQHARHRSTVISDFGFGARTNRGLGLAALFHGESGTGKTLAAEAVAHELGVPLLRIDSASLFSKYYGETEKNIRRTFDAAEAGGAVCFFDECDSFSSRRVEANDSRDQFLNVQINYLLTRIDSFTGVAIMATNMKHALDPALIRRSRYVIEFSFPSVAEREEIWRAVFPSETPLGVLNYAHLARFVLSGGSIYNAAIAAAHSAAAEFERGRQAVEMPHILEAVRAELIKIGRPASNAAFQATATANGSGQEDAA